jgi:hypothetical protein
LKNKSLTYFLLLVVGGVWYQVFQKIKNNFEADVPVVNLSTTTPSRISLSKDTFALNITYGSPFEHDLRHVAKDSTKIVEETKAIAPKIKSEAPWYVIKYYGLIQKTESKKPLALLKIDGVSFRLRTGEEAFDGYLVKAIYNDSVLIEYKKKLKYFHKK